MATATGQRFRYPCDPPLSSEPERLAVGPGAQARRSRPAVYSFGGMKPRPPLFRRRVIRFPEFFPASVLLPESFRGRLLLRRLPPVTPLKTLGLEVGLSRRRVLSRARWARARLSVKRHFYVQMRHAPRRGKLRTEDCAGCSRVLFRSPRGRYRCDRNRRFRLVSAGSECSPDPEWCSGPWRR